MKAILEEIRAERELQNIKWGEQNHTPIEWIAILMEEVGEASKDAVDYHFRNGLNLLKDTNQEVRINDIQITRLRAYRMELVQVCAVAVQMIESLDRNELRTESV